MLCRRMRSEQTVFVITGVFRESDETSAEPHAKLSENHSTSVADQPTAARTKAQPSGVARSSPCALLPWISSRPQRQRAAQLPGGDKPAVWPGLWFRPNEERPGRTQVPWHGESRSGRSGLLTSGSCKRGAFGR
jgi:hypothetical protein